MRYIFCKVNSSNSKSIEHIIPESLGNKTHTLYKGIVCDKCNNYFSHKIEKPVSEIPYFKLLRGRKMIENKKGKIPRISAFTKDKDIIDISFLLDESDILKIKPNNKKIFESIKIHNKLYVPILPKPPLNDLSISKFIGKIALEALAKRVSKAQNWQDNFVENDGLDELRNFVRYGKGYPIWPYYIRRIYGENKISYDKDLNKIIETLNEYDFLIPDNPSINKEYHQINNLYFVMAIMGIEYTINLTNGGLDRYINWLSENQNKSILLMEKSEFHSNLNL